MKLRKACKVVLKHFEAECCEMSRLGHEHPEFTEDWVLSHLETPKSELSSTTEYRYTVFFNDDYMGDFMSKAAIYEHFSANPKTRTLDETITVMDYDIARKFGCV